MTIQNLLFLWLCRVLKPPILIWGVLINGVCIVGVNPLTVVPAES